MIQQSLADIIRRQRGMVPQAQAPLASPYDVEQSGAEDLGGSSLPTADIAAVGGVQPDPADVAQVTAELEAQPDLDSSEMASAQEADRRSGLSSGLELASRQLVGGITQTPVGQSLPRAPSQVPMAQAAAKSRATLAAEALRRKDAAAKDAAAGVERKDSREERAAAILRAQQEKRDAEAESLRRFEISGSRQDAATKASQDISRASLGLQKGASARADTKAAEDASDKALKKTEDIPPGFEISAGANPGAESRKKFAALVGSSEKMKGLTANMRKALAGTNALSRTMDPKTVTALRQLGTMIQIEGKNVAGLGALSGPDMGLMNSIAADPTSVKANLSVDLPKMLDQLDAWGDSQVAGEGRASGIVRAQRAGSHGAVTFEGGGVREYADGFIEEM